MMGLWIAMVVIALIACAPWQLAASSRSRLGRRSRADATVVAPAPAVDVDQAVVLDLVRAALASGADVVSAIAAVGAALPEHQGRVLVRAARALRLGATWEVAWADRGSGGGGDRDLESALAPSWEDGVDPEPLLRHAASMIRSSRQARAREAAAKLGVRLVIPLGLCLLPAFVLLGLVPVLISAGLSLWGG